MKESNGLNELRKKMMERWTLMVNFKGDWNSGYAEGLNYAMSLIYDELREIEKNKPIKIDHAPKKEWSKFYGTKKGVK